MVLAILDKTGHTALDTKELGVEEVETRFNELVKNGYLTYKVSSGEAELTRKFDPDAETIVAHAPMVGG